MQRACFDAVLCLEILAMSDQGLDQDVPSLRLRQPGVIVYLCGIATSLLTIFAVKWGNAHDFYPMGWFVNGILPAGAIFIGIVSGVGYAVGSRLLHVKVGHWFLALMFVTGAVDYFAVQYFTYTSILDAAGAPPDAYSFIDYLRDHAENMSFRDRHGGNQPGSPLGLWGYCFQLLIVLGFAIGAMIPSLVVFGMNYCHRCQIYLKNHRIGYLRSPESWTEVKALAKAERKAALDQIGAAIVARAEHFAQSVTETDFAQTDALMRDLDSQAPSDSAAHVVVTLMKCPRCDAHHLSASLFTYDAGKQNASAQLFVLDKTLKRPPRPVADEDATGSSSPPPPASDQSIRAG
jgi:hypothetical protein